MRRKLFSATALIVGLVMILTSVSPVFACHATPNVDCNGYSFDVVPAGGGSFEVKSGSLSGSWGTETSASVTIQFLKPKPGQPGKWEKDGEPQTYTANKPSDCPVPPPDLCPNIDGIQEVVPDGMYIDNKGDCVPDTRKVTICHWTNENASHLYNEISVSINSIASKGDWLNGHGGEPNDIWPSFTAKNGDLIEAHGDQSILANGCKVPEPPVTNTAELTIVNDCHGGHIEVSANNGGTYPSLPSWTWTNPYALEAVPGGSITVTWTSGTPLTMALPYSTIEEPKECLVTLPHTYKVEKINNCDGYEWKVTVDDGKYEADMPLFGKWVDKYTQEESPVPTVTLTWDDGHVEKITLDKIIEPVECVITDGHEFQVTPKSSCDGYSWKIEVKNGKYEVLEGVLSGSWTSKYDQEKSPNPTVKLSWVDGFTKTIKLDTIVEPANCVPDRPTPEPTPTPAPQDTGAGDGMPWTFPVGLGLVGLALIGFFWPKP